MKLSAVLALLVLGVGTLSFGDDCNRDLTLINYSPKPPFGRDIGFDVLPGWEQKIYKGVVRQYLSSENQDTMLIGFHTDWGPWFDLPVADIPKLKDGYLRRGTLYRDDRITEDYKNLVFKTMSMERRLMLAVSGSTLYLSVFNQANVIWRESSINEPSRIPNVNNIYNYLIIHQIDVNSVAPGKEIKWAQETHYHLAGDNWVLESTWDWGDVPASLPHPSPEYLKEAGNSQFGQKSLF